MGANQLKISLVQSNSIVGGISLMLKCFGKAGKKKKRIRSNSFPEMFRLPTSRSCKQKIFPRGYRFSGSKYSAKDKQS